MDRELMEMAKDFQNLDDFQLATTLPKLTNQEKLFAKKFLEDFLKKTDQTKARKKSKYTTISKEETFLGMINKIDKALNAYALNEQIDEITFDFEINPTLENVNDQRLIDLHKKLIKSGEGTVKVDLFIRVERGRLYLHIKNTKVGEWNNFCENQFNICPRTAYRHIEFFKLCSHYPRLLIVGLSFDTIMNFSKNLVSYLKTNTDFAGRLSAPLKSTKFINTIINVETLFPDNGSSRLQISRERTNWNPGWEITDELLHQQEKLNTPSGDGMMMEGMDMGMEMILIHFRMRVQALWR